MKSPMYFHLWVLKPCRMALIASVPVKAMRLDRLRCRQHPTSSKFGDATLGLHHGRIEVQLCAWLSIAVLAGDLHALIPEAARALKCSWKGHNADQRRASLQRAKQQFLSAKQVLSKEFSGQRAAGRCGVGLNIFGLASLPT